MAGIADHDFFVSLLAGAGAGLSVDLILFPLDTVKTRLQSAAGFRKAGGFTKLYSGVGSVALGAAPGSAAFFLTYDTFKRLLSTKQWEPVAHLEAAALGEIAACCVRVPVEVVKQRSQALSGNSWYHLRHALRTEGLRGLYRGYGSTVAREIPFSVIQFPIWEFLKKAASSAPDSPPEPLIGAACGAVAGGIAGLLTTPLDVAKTRIILNKEAGLTIPDVLVQVHRERGIQGLFAGYLPRTMSLMIGGFIFLGAYELTKETLTRVL